MTNSVLRDKRRRLTLARYQLRRLQQKTLLYDHTITNLRHPPLMTGYSISAAMRKKQGNNNDDSLLTEPMSNRVIDTNLAYTQRGCTSILRTWATVRNKIASPSACPETASQRGSLGAFVSGLSLSRRKEKISRYFQEDNLLGTERFYALLTRLGADTTGLPTSKYSVESRKDSAFNRNPVKQNNDKVYPCRTQQAQSDCIESRPALLSKTIVWDDQVHVPWKPTSDTLDNHSSDYINGKIERVLDLEGFASEKVCLTAKRLIRGGVMQKIPRNSSLTRIKNRCIDTGRGKGVFRICKLSRIRFREKASQGLLNGISKASW